MAGQRWRRARQGLVHLHQIDASIPEAIWFPMVQSRQLARLARPVEFDIEPLMIYGQGQACSTDGIAA